MIEMIETEEEYNSGMLAVERLMRLSGGIMRAEISEVFRTTKEVNSLISAMATGMICNDDVRVWIQPRLCFVMMAGAER